MAEEKRRFTRAGDAVQEIVRRLGRNIRVALPLGLGKPVTLLDALTRLAVEDRSIKLSIDTALTLEPPDAGEGMRARFIGPARERLFGNYPVPLYARLRREGGLPPNIEVREFFLLAGRWLGVDAAQQDYVPANYTDAVRQELMRQPNLLLQLLAEDGDALNLSCNTDISADLLERRREGSADFLFAGELNPALPAMAGKARIAGDEADILLDPPEPFELFSAVKRPVGPADHAIGLHVSRLVRDGGTLQIGIGAIGDAVAHALLLRHRGAVSPIWAACPFPLGGFREDGGFEAGLYGCSEMLVDGMLRLFEGGVIRRQVDGAAIHAAFFVDCRDFYRRLRDMDAGQRERVAMMPVSFTNTLLGDEPAKRAARRDAHFVNSAMKVTALGAVISDAVADGQVVSGVGGQLDFVLQAFALDAGRSIITLPSTRRSKGKLESNIVWSFPHATIPWHLRDLVVTEYGIADLRGKTDAEAILAMISIADSRFQDNLLDQARSAGKIPSDRMLPEASRNNLPEAVATWLAPFDRDLPAFPFGTDFTPLEQALLPALALLERHASSLRGKARLVRAAAVLPPHPEEGAALGRMAFDTGGGGLNARAGRIALRGALRLAAKEAAERGT